MVRLGNRHVVVISTRLVAHADSTRPGALASLTKGGLVADARSLAIEYAGSGVRVTAFSLGVIKTPTHDPAGRVRVPRGRANGPIGDVVDGILYPERAPFVRSSIRRLPQRAAQSNEATDQGLPWCDRGACSPCSRSTVATVEPRHLRHLVAVAQGLNARRVYDARSDTFTAFGVPAVEPVDARRRPFRCAR
jgi:hypothetical protein